MNVEWDEGGVAAASCRRENRQPSRRRVVVVGGMLITLALVLMFTLLSRDFIRGPAAAATMD